MNSHSLGQNSLNKLAGQRRPRIGDKGQERHAAPTEITDARALTVRQLRPIRGPSSGRPHTERSAKTASMTFTATMREPYRPYQFGRLPRLGYAFVAEDEDTPAVFQNAHD